MRNFRWTLAVIQNRLYLRLFGFGEKPLVRPRQQQFSILSFRLSVYYEIVNSHYFIFVRTIQNSCKDMESATTKW